MAAQRDSEGRFIKGHITNVGRPRSEETKHKISEAMKGRTPTSGSYQKGNQLWKRRKRAGMRNGQTNSGSFKKEQTPWNKGLTKTDPRVVRNIEEMAKTKRRLYAEGKIRVWNTGLTKETDERVQQVSKTKKGIRTVWGEKHGNWQGGKSFEIYPIEFNRVLKELIRKRDNYTCQRCGIHQGELKQKLSVHHIDRDKFNNDPTNLIAYCKSCHHKIEWEALR